MTLFLSTLLKPFFAVVFFFLAYVLARLVGPLIPNGAIKRILYDKTIYRRYPWRFSIGFMVAAWGLMFIIYFLVRG